MKKRYPQRFRTVWLEDSRFQNWLQRVEGDETLAFCRFCRCSVKAKLCDLDRHHVTVKHIRAAVKHMRDEEKICDGVDEEGIDIEDNKLAMNFDVTLHDTSKNDHCLTACQVQSIVDKFKSAPNEIPTGNKAIEAIRSFYEAVNSPSPSHVDNSDEAFVKYLGEELKSIKNVFVKKKLKQKILNIVYSTDDVPDGQEVLHPFPIFVSSPASIPLAPLDRSNSTENES